MARSSTRSSLTPQRTPPARTQEVRDSQQLREPSVLPFPSLFARRRDEISDTLVSLAAAWRTLEMSDEAGWAAFAADAATSLAWHLRQHFEAVRAAMIASGCPSPWSDGSTVDMLYRVRDEDGGGGDGLPDEWVGGDWESGADAVLLAFTATTEALQAGDDAWSCDDTADGTPDVLEATDCAATTTDGVHPRHSAQHAS